MKFINLTPHTLNVRTSNGEVVNITPAGTVARVSSTSIEIAGGVGPFALAAIVYEIKGLPDPVEEDTIFIVDPVVADRVLDRDDVVAPGELIANDDIVFPIYTGLKTSGGGL